MAIDTTVYPLKEVENPDKPNREEREHREGPNSMTCWIEVEQASACHY
jgi:hypothetical protein